MVWFGMGVYHIIISLYGMVWYGCLSYNSLIFICNGRIGDDKGIGKSTSKNASVVDYAICSPLLFKIIEIFFSIGD